jgi:uncharacterized membrane protein YhaH (DUF805 family)
MSLLILLFSYKGRIRRPAFWQGTILPAAIIIIVYYLTKDYYPFYNAITISGSAILTWIITAGLCKRLHDLNYSGWYQLLFFIPATAVYALSLKYTIQPWAIALGFTTYLIGLWILLWAAIISGSPEYNRYSERPNAQTKSDNKLLPNFTNIFNRKNNNINNLKQSNKLEAGKQAVERLALLDQVPLTTPTFTINSKDDQDRSLDEKEPEILRSTESIFTAQDPE